MRIWGRLTHEDGTKTWCEVSTDANGNNDAVYLTWLAQVCKLNLGESPMFGNWGIPAHASVEQQIAPDFYMQQIQQQFSKFFASVILTKLPPPIGQQPLTPQYRLNVLLRTGAVVSVTGFPGGTQFPT